MKHLAQTLKELSKQLEIEIEIEINNLTSFTENGQNSKKRKMVPHEMAIAIRLNISIALLARHKKKFLIANCNQG